MEIKEFIEIYEEEGVKGIRGQFVLSNPSVEPKDNEIIGISCEDFKEGDLVKIKI